MASLGYPDTCQYSDYLVNGTLPNSNSSSFHSSDNCFIRYDVTVCQSILLLLTAWVISYNLFHWLHPTEFILQLIRPLTHQLKHEVPNQLSKIEGHPPDLELTYLKTMAELNQRARRVLEKDLTYLREELTLKEAEFAGKIQRLETNQALLLGEKDYYSNESKKLKIELINRNDYVEKILKKKKLKFQEKFENLKQNYETKLAAMRTEYNFKYRECEKSFMGELNKRMELYRQNQVKTLQIIVENCKQNEAHELTHKVEEEMAPSLNLNFTHGLLKFSRSLEPTLEFIENGHWAANLVYNILKENTQFQIDRYVIAGSCGKNTMTFDDHNEVPNFAIIIFLNDVAPPFKKEIEIIVKTLQEYSQKFKQEIDDHGHDSASEEVKFKVKFSTELLVRFEYRHIPFDLLPAKNYSSQSQSDLEIDPERKSQFEGCLKDMQKFENQIIRAGYNFSSVRLFRSSMSELSINFFKGQSQFTHDLIRIAKYWDTHVQLDGSGKGEDIFVSGRPFLIELVAIYASEILEKKNLAKVNDLYDGVQTFLELMTNFGNLNIIFTKFYERQVVPSTILSKRPLILDPVCPYHNLASFRKHPQANRKIVLQFQHKAELSLVKLKSMKMANFKDLKDIQDIFK